MSVFNKRDGKKKTAGVYMNNVLTRKIYVPYVNLGKNIKEIIEKILKNEIEGKCTIEGFIKPNSIKIISYSSGLLSEEKVMFDVVFECSVCSPVEGMKIECKVKNITQAGVKAVVDEEVSPVVIYASRDHHYNNSYFNTIKEDDTISIRVIGQRFELNDQHVSVIGEVVEPKKIDKSKVVKKKLVLKK